MAMTAAVKRNRYVDQQIRQFAMATGIKIWEGGLCQINAGGYLAKSVSGAQMFIGVAYETVDNTAGADGAALCRVWTQGDFDLPIAATVTIADVGSPVYAAADDIVTLTPGTTNYCGLILHVLSATLVTVRLKGTEAAP